MRKASVINGLALALVLGATTVASAQGQNRAERQRGVQADSGFRRGPAGRGVRGGEGFLLRGITLTAEQKTRIAAIGEKERKAFEAKRPKGEKREKGERGAQRQRGDSAAFAARRAEMEKRREQHVAELRAVLTSEQRVVFDKNVAEMKQRVAQRGERGKGFKGGKRA